ncbi:MAG: hypothetical protein A2136_02120 [Chloroflexi bacterium RBG_16_54_11]|nr:MAG: hypothetical protein A2136_02120 [Chloroflexi bacterium RBG_16_54_11]
MVCLLFSLLVASPVQADMGVQPILPGGSNIQPEGETPIQMASEKVVLNVRPATGMDDVVVTRNPGEYGLSGSFDGSSGMYPAVADVLADFTMANPTDKVVSMTAWFPLASALETEEWNLNPGEVVPRIERFQVILGYRPLEYTIYELPNPKGEDKPPLPWASFPVTFPPGEETHVQVSYVVPAWWDYNGLTMSFYYVFQTGAGWSGSIGKAELVINLPYPASAETIYAMPEGGLIGGHQVRWTWLDFEPGPQDDFFIKLLMLNRWDELQAARAAVAGNPQDGESWLNLASTYSMLTRGRSYSASRMLPGFGEIYQPLGVQAAQEALRLLPNDGRPHYELAILYTSTIPENATIEHLKPVLEELKIVEELEPALAPNIHDALDFIGVFWAVETARAEASSIPQPSASTAPTKEPALTQRIVPSTTPQPQTTVTPQGIAWYAPGSQGSFIVNILMIMVVFVLITVLAYLFLKRR